jgi:hypothetical protein
MPSTSQQCEKNRDSKIRYIVDLQSKMYMADLKAYMSPPLDNADARCYWILQCWLEYMSQLKDSADNLRSFLHDRIATACDQLLKHGTRGIELIGRVLSKKEWRKQIEQNFDEAIRKTLLFASERLDRFFDAGGEAEFQAGPENASKDVVSQADGMVVLYGVLIFETYSGNTDAAEVLLELNQGTQDGSFPTEVLIEVLLSLASQPSKLFRTAVATVFGTTISGSSGLGIGGVKSLTRILLTKENTQGQQEMFEAANDEDLEGTHHENDSDDEVNLDSDVEMINGVDQPFDGSEESSPETSDNDSVSNEGEDINNADAYAALDVALASALGNSKSNPEESASDSDPDLSDSEMLALDAQLSTVFREHASVLSQRKAQKKTQKQTKEALINFKNRALDLVEMFLKRQPLNPLCFDFLLPLLQAIDITKTKRFAERCCAVLREYSAKCKGQNVPILPNTEDNNALATLSGILRQIHDLATKAASNAHAAACSQVSLLVTKVLVKSCGKEGLESAVDRYSKTQMLWLVEQGSGVELKPQFFTDWNNWCGSMAGKVLKGREEMQQTNFEVTKSASKKKGKERGKVEAGIDGHEPKVEEPDKDVEESKSSKKSSNKGKKERERQESNKERKQRMEDRTVWEEEEARKERRDEIAEVWKEKELPHWAAEEGRERQMKLKKQRLGKEQKREKKQKKK